MPLGDQHPIHLPQHLMGIRGELQYMGQQDHIETLCGERQRIRFAAEMRGSAPPAGKRILQRHDDGVPNPACGKQLPFSGGAHLKKVVAEQIRQNRLHLQFFLLEQQPAGRQMKPGPQSPPCASGLLLLMLGFCHRCGATAGCRQKLYYTRSCRK